MRDCSLLVASHLRLDGDFGSSGRNDPCTNFCPDQTRYRSCAGLLSSRAAGGSEQDLRPEDTNGWVGSHFDLVDKISPAERPRDTSAYTHKLNFELDTAVHIFNWLPEANWLRNIELEGSLDYVATGLPRAGDRIGNELFLDNASGWSFLPCLRHPAPSHVAVTRSPWRNFRSPLASGST